MSKKSPLNEITGYYDMLSIYENNKKQPYDKWLDHKETFKNSGKQGIVGVMSIKDEYKIKENTPNVIYKMSQYINYLIQHESKVMESLNEISPYCPHFCKSIGVISCAVDAKYKKNNDNPFVINSKHPIEKEVLLMEHIEHSCKLYNYIRSPKITENIIFSTIKQVLMAIAIAQNKKQFSHYDLHSFNIMMKKCEPDVVFLYILDDETQFAVPTLGHYPVIIDFGFSYINSMEDGALWPSMGHTDVGFMSDRFDWVADPKLFLVTVSGEIRSKRKTKKSIKFRHIVKNIFNNLTIDWQSGWDKINSKGAMDYISLLLNKHTIPESIIFNKYEHYSLDLIQSLIILPLEPKDYSNIHISYKAFVKEFLKIEKLIGDSFYNLYILKGIVDIARTVRPDYLNQSTRENAIKYFRLAVHDRINYVANFCHPKNIHYELMLCALIEFARKMEGYLYKVINKTMKRKEREYKKLPLNSVEQIYGAIEVNIPDTYVYNEKTKVFILNCVDKTSDIMNIPNKYLEELNNTHTLGKGVYLYNLYKQK